MKLIIGNKNYSSWSLRPWLLLSVNNISFEEIRIPLFTENTHKEFAKYTKAGKVPVLHDNEIVVWDSLAICEYVSEQLLDGKGWPADVAHRAEARSCCAEMHSSFFALREQMPMNCRANIRSVPMTDELQKDISRVDSLWSDLRAKYSSGGPWLFGEFSIVDCMFAPVVFRFSTYNVDVCEASKSYMNTLLANPKVKLWLEHAKAEVEVIDYAEVGK